MSGEVLLALVCAGLVPILWVVVTYNRIIRLRNHVRESWSNVDSVLKRRHDLIPNLVRTVQAFADHERDVFERIARARAQVEEISASVLARANAEGELTRCTRALLARAEAYPSLRSSANFLELQRELVNTEDRIAAARRFYNANVRDHNSTISSFPSNLVAGFMQAQPEEYFEIETA